MRIITTAELFNRTENYVFATLVQGEPTEKTKYGTDEVQVTPEGKVIYRTGLTAIRLTDSGNYPDSSVTLAVTDKNLKFEPGKFYRIAGKSLFVTPYVAQNKRLGISLIAETLTEYAPTGGEKHE